MQLLGDQGQLNDEQIAKIMPRRQSSARLRRGEGSSYDRRVVEVDRAERGLPPMDNLRGMSSYDILVVKQARINHGTGE